MIMDKLIYLYGGKVTVVDEEDYEELSKYKWSLTSNGYAKRTECNNIGRKTVRMHRQIMKVNENQELDHINGDKLDNRKGNLRIVTHGQNMFNKKRYANASSKYKGVRFYNVTNKWISRIGINRERIHIGYYATEEAAAKAYNNKAKELFGEYARLNEV